MSASVHLVRGADGPQLQLRLVDRERELLTSLTGQLIELLADEAAAVGEDHSDPAMGRLLPHGYRNDDEAAEEFRRYTRAGLIDRKSHGAAVIGRALETDGPIQLTAAAAEQWLPVLTDLRLVLAERLGIDDGDDRPGGPIAEVYDWIGILQASLIAQLDLIDRLNGHHASWDTS